MTDGFNTQWFGNLSVERNYDPSLAGVDWRKDRAIHVKIAYTYNSTTLNLDQAKAARDHLTALIEEIEENLNKPVKTTYSELQPGDLYVYADPCTNPGAPKYIHLTDGRCWSTVMEHINILTGIENPDRPVWIIKGTEV